MYSEFCRQSLPLDALLNRRGEFIATEAAQEICEMALAAQLDSFIQWHEMKAETVYQDYPNEAGHIQHGRIAAHVKSARELKEARTSLTNSTHE